MSKINRYEYCVAPNEILPEAYEQAVFEFIGYYRRRAKFYKRFNGILSVVNTILLAIIPITQVLDANKEFVWIATVVSSLCIVIETVREMFHMRKKWILYQHTNNLLMSEQRQYRSAAGEYSDMPEEKRFIHFVNCVEKILSNESDDWKKILSSYKSKEQDN